MPSHFPRFSSPCISCIYLGVTHLVFIFVIFIVVIYSSTQYSLHFTYSLIYSPRRLTDIIHAKHTNGQTVLFLRAQICLHALRYGMLKSKYNLMEILPSVLPVHNLLIQFLTKQTISDFGSVRSNSHCQRSRTRIQSEFSPL